MMRKMNKKSSKRRKRKPIYLIPTVSVLILSLRRAAKTLAKIIQEKGKGFTIFYDMFRDIDVIIEWGATFDEDAESLDEVDSM